jgi:hypothetical protein
MNEAGETYIAYEPEKLDPKIGYVVRSCIETWVNIHNQELEQELDELREEIEMMRRLLSEKDVNIAATGSRRPS